MSFGQAKDKSTVTGLLGQTLDSVMAGAQVNQIRGVTVANNVGAGIPKQVTDVAASVSNATTGSTNVVKVTFRRDPADVSFAKALIYVRGYNGNNADVQMASGTDSPITFVLNNTGESIVVTVQSSGNAGDAPLASSPTTGIRLPQSTAGGYGTTTVTTSTTGLTGDVTTTGTASPLTATVVGFQGKQIVSRTPTKGDVWRYNEYGDSKWDLTNAFPTTYWAMSNIGGSTGYTNVPNSVTPATVGTVSNKDGTAVDPPAQRYTGAAGASVNVTAGVDWPQAGAAYIGFGSLRKMSIRALLNTTSGSRYWVGLAEYKATLATSAWATDTPNMNFAAFRRSVTTDTTIKAVCGTDNTHITTVDTGVAIDTTNSQLFEIAYDGTTVYFYINGTQVATIASNVMPASTLIVMNAFGDNKNAAGSVVLDVCDLRMTIG